MSKSHFSLCFLVGFLFLGIMPAFGTERLCDVSFEDCRAPLLKLIQNETVEIDAAFWFMDDATLSSALIKKFQSGVPVRILMDPRAEDGHPTNAQVLAQLASAGIPMRNRTADGILHWKMMLFSGQGTVEFSGANFTPSEMRPYTPYVNYTDEAIYYSDDPAVVNSFRTKYDDWWTDTTDYLNYAKHQCAAAAELCNVSDQFRVGLPAVGHLEPGLWHENYGRHGFGKGQARHRHVSHH